MASQFNGLFAARILELKECSKIQSFGQVLSLQQCWPLGSELKQWGAISVLHILQEATELEQLKVMTKFMGRIARSEGGSLASVKLSQNEISHMNLANVGLPILNILSLM